MTSQRTALTPPCERQQRGPPAPALERRLLFLLLLPVLFLAPPAESYASGAPESVCSTMMPDHMPSTMTYSNPYRLLVSSNTYGPLQLITVTIAPVQQDLWLRGFMLQARPSTDRESEVRVGSFKDESESQAICSNKAATHAFATERPNITVSWRAPPVPTGDIVFRATVVREYSDYYTKVDSVVIAFQLPNASSEATTDTSSTTAATTLSMNTTKTLSPSATEAATTSTATSSTMTSAAATLTTASLPATSSTSLSAVAVSSSSSAATAAVSSLLSVTASPSPFVATGKVTMTGSSIASSGQGKNIMTNVGERLHIDMLLWIGCGLLCLSKGIC